MEQQPVQDVWRESSHGVLNRTPESAAAARCTGDTESISIVVWERRSAGRVSHMHTHKEGDHFNGRPKTQARWVAKGLGCEAWAL